MQAISSYKSDQHSTISAALQRLEDFSRGLSASSYFSRQGVFARFVWPDWPESLATAFANQVNEFHQQHRDLKPVAKGTREWQAVFRDWGTDPDSVAVIADAFSRRFGDRLKWVESERDSRGRVGALCMIQGLLQISPARSDGSMSKIIQESAARRAETVPCSLQLSWKDCTANPPGPLSDADRDAFQASVGEVFNWARRRIQPILDTLHDKLKALYGERFRGLYVFGSYARPDAGIQLPNDSDLDVALLLSDMTNAYDEIKRFGEITSDLTSEYGLVVSVTPIREEDYLHDRTNFIRVIKEDAVEV